MDGKEGREERMEEERDGKEKKEREIGEDRKSSV